MAAITQLSELLKAMSPELQAGEFVFCTVAGHTADYQHLNPLAYFREAEGLTLILALEDAQQAQLPVESRFKQITLTVHSSLEAVGLTAAVASQLAERGISANVVAAYYHDHIFVQSEKAEAALVALRELSAKQS
jgi:hypothetical protein